MASKVFVVVRAGGDEVGDVTIPGALTIADAISA